MSLRFIKTTPELSLALAGVYHWQSTIYENADCALSRAKGLADFLAHSACHVPKGDAIYPESLYALAESISKEIAAVQLMLLELGGVKTEQA